MRIRSKKWARPELEARRYFIPNPTEYKNKWRSFFLNNNPIYLDLGCGKGLFLAEMALRRPDINFIGVDISIDILGVANRNIKKIFGGKEPKNLALTSMNLEYCEDAFGQEDNISRIYIYFCNPWPKNRHKKRRLIYPRQLNKYLSFLNLDGQIYFKTDDDCLFKDSLEYFKETGFSSEFLTRDLQTDQIEEEKGILSEHELMFRRENIPIKMIIASKKDI